MYAVPVVIAVIAVFGAVKRVPVFDCFTEGTKEGLKSIVSIAPSLIGLIFAVTMLEASGFFDLLSSALSPLCVSAGVPPQVVPLAVMRPVTGSGSFAVLSGIIEKYGADSLIGKTASVISGSTETTFYAITVYYGAVGIKKTRYTVPAALTADMIGMLTAVWSCAAFG